MAENKLVLVVDDDEAMLMLLAHLVREQGYRVETASDGEEAGRRVDALKPDLVVLDLMLPRYGGFELLRDLQRSAELSKIPIVIVTGRYTDRSTTDMIRKESNVVELLEKPVDQAQFRALLERVLGGKA